MIMTMMRMMVMMTMMMTKMMILTFLIRVMVELVISQPHFQYGDNALAGTICIQYTKEKVSPRLPYLFREQLPQAAGTRYSSLDSNGLEHSH